MFANPQPVEIYGLPRGAGGTPISTEEPFISRDGRFLFFNTAQKENNKDLHFAEKQDSRWVYRGEIGPGVNNPKDVQGNPTMDGDHRFFYIDSGAKPMVRMARFSPQTGRLSDIDDFVQIPTRKVKLLAQKFQGNMGVEINPDGSTIYFSRATWDMNGFSLGKLLKSDILFVQQNQGRYIYDANEVRRIMQNINSTDLDYAASISADGLELFFTRLALEDIKPGKVRSAILRATRTGIGAPFGRPSVVEAIGTSGFVEGPAISANGRELYYHKHNGQKFTLYKVTR